MALLVLLLLVFQAVAGTLTAELTGAVAGQDGDVVVYADSARRSPQASVLEPDAIDRVAAVDGVTAAAGVTWVPYSVDGTDSVLVGSTRRVPVCRRTSARGGCPGRTTGRRWRSQGWPTTRRRSASATESRFQEWTVAPRSSASSTMEPPTRCPPGT